MELNVCTCGSPPRAVLRLTLALIAVLALLSPALSITVTSRGESSSQGSSSTPARTPISSQNFTLALQMLERMLLSQQRQRRLIPYYYLLSSNEAGGGYTAVPRPLPTPFPVQNTALDLLTRSLFSPYVLRNYQQQQSYQQQQQKYQQHNSGLLNPYRTYTPTRPTLPVLKPSYADLFQQIVRPKQPLPKAPSVSPLDVFLSPDINVPARKVPFVFPSNKPAVRPLIKQLPLTPEELDELLPIRPTPEPDELQLNPTPEPALPPPSLPQLLSPLASVTRFPGPPAKKAGKDTPGRAGVDYPTYYKIPPTSFSCATQRYKGFFADPDTSCQVWHYCDLNGGQASFLCPNGTIFSQVLLTCDWWFNVKCTNTLQAYVLNERLYKFIMPKKPSFPEDYTGLQVDDYLTQKLPELREKEIAKAERLKKKYKPFEFDDVDELQALLDKMRKGQLLEPEQPTQEEDKFREEAVSEEQV